MTKIESVHIKGYKSIIDETVQLKPINIVIGPNGSGKSSLLEAISIIANASKAENKISYAASYLNSGTNEETTISADADGQNIEVKRITGTRNLVSIQGKPSDEIIQAAASWETYDFSELSLKNLKAVKDNQKALRISNDGTNLIAYLKHIKEDQPSWHEYTKKALKRYIHHPQDSPDIMTLSNGSLRIFALMSVLDNAYRDQAETLFIEHPEAGTSETFLRSFAVQIQAIAERTQVIITTHSTKFADQFKPEDLIVAENSTFRRVNQDSSGDFATIKRSK